MKILYIFFCFCIKNAFCQYDVNEILSVNVDGLLMKEASITASATCGMNGPEKFCRLVDEGLVIGDPGQEAVMCDICDDRNQSKRHPIEYAKSDDQNLWWQSPSMAQGSEYQRVNITIDLKQVYQIVYILLKMADSPRPGTWILERSDDGIHYLPWIFFADTPYACFNFFQRYNPNIKLTTYARPQSLGDDEVFCTTYYSQPNSLIAGEIIISLINGRQSLIFQDDNQPRSIPLKLINFLSARFIRFRFMKPLTLAADLMTHKGHLEKSIYNRYYYSLRNIEIGGKCICNNHADKCDKVIKEGRTVAKCNCKHNTCGNNCEHCCPLYNQKPWRQGAICEECNCNNKTQICVYNQTVATLQLSMNKFGQMDGGGVCVGCSDNTDGINCEKCRMGYYRPWNVRASQPSPCQLCSCFGVGTIGTCISNGEEVEPQKPGDCICKKGYKGNQCQECDLGYEFKNGQCLPCPCSIDGSVTSSLYRCKPPCNCKVNVDASSNCNKCKEHFFNLHRSNVDGCEPCYCFGITDRCQSLSGANLKIQSVENWHATTLSLNQEATPRISSQQYPILENSVIDSSLGSPSVYYWRAPQLYLGNWLTSYRGVLQYVIKIDIDSPQSGSQIDSPDVIIKCGLDQMFHSVSTDDRRMQRKVEIPINLRFWKFVTVSGSTKDPSKDEFMSCLVNVWAVLIKAKYYSNQINIGLLNVTLDRGDVMSAINNMPQIEKCDCPQGVTGLSCESCDVGYRRVNNILVNGRCERCECFQHSNSCDPMSGHCKDCMHHTNGQNCETCEPGYYGNSRTGDVNACKRCACPREDYQLTNMCSSFELSNYICHECTEKSGGHQCQRCIEGYYGNPLKKIPCQKCQCHDNEESCDTVTGKCRCSYNTMGSQCEVCKHGFYGDALKKTCRICNCSSFGSQSQFCNKTAGQCPCKANFENRTCDTCAAGLYLTNGLCVPCSCDRDGRVISSRFCDSSTGQCKCRDGVAGPRCDRCLPDHYGFPDCKKCLCSNHSRSSDCDSRDGRCSCGKNVADNKCEKCLDLFYWSNRTDCTACNCAIGSTKITCDMNSGQCPCAPYVTGRTCDQCDFGYYGISRSGCRKCPECRKGKVCNNDGICVCPSNTEGDTCGSCVEQSWGYNKNTGCKKCDCFLPGSIGPACDMSNGQCTCRPEFTGQKCQTCAKDYFGFPQCRPCNCNKNGITPHQASACDGISGSCSCKINVEGDRCDRCKNGTFGFDGEYAAGCYSCYCSGQSKKCSLQSEYRVISNGVHKYQILADNEAFVPGKDQRVIELSARMPPMIRWPLGFFRPVYADVTNLLSGSDLSLLYGKVLFIADIDCQSNACGREYSQQDEAVIESYGGAMELRYSVKHTRPVNRKIVVQMKEFSSHGQWFLTRSNNLQLNKPVNLSQSDLTVVARELIMYALINVTKVKIQLYSSTVNPSGIKVNLETFAAVNSQEGIGEAVTGVEKCECGDTTTGLHCENPIHGYYRVPNNIPEIFFNLSVRIGFRVEKCFCNGHSRQCNMATGECYQCLNNTAGNKCQLCADGFYGDAKNNGTCFKCECPSKNYNYAKKCSKTSTLSTFECECRKGHTGSLCEKCQEEFFGFPISGIECQSCNCNPDGSLSSICDQNGKCTCATGVMGDKCDQCTANYAVENKKCQNCLTGCTKDLFLRAEALNQSVVTMKWKTLPSKGQMKLDEINASLTVINKKLSNVNKLFELMEEIAGLEKKVRDTKENLRKNLKEAQDTRDAYSKTLIKIFELFKEINETIYGGQHSRVSWEMIKNATAILSEIDLLKGSIPNIRDVETELQLIQNHIDRINKIRKGLQSRIDQKQLTNVRDLISKTMLADSINKDNKEYLKTLSSKVADYEDRMKLYRVKINDTQREYNETLVKKILLDNQMLKLKQLISGFEEKKNKTLDIIREIESLLRIMSTDWSSSENLIIPDSVKEYVNSIVNKSKNLVKNLLESFNILSRAEDAKQAYSSISKDINDVEGAINSTSKQLIDSRNQLKIDKYSINIDQINANHSQVMGSMKIKETDYQILYSEYNSLKDKRIQLGENNMEMMNQIPNEVFEVDSLNKSISSIDNQQQQNQKSIDYLTKTLTAFQVPKSGDLNVTDIAHKFTELKNQYTEIKNEANSVIVSIKELRERLQNIRDRFKKRKIYTELAHGAAAKSPEPIRLDKSCVRHYQTYFLPRSNAFSIELYMRPQFLTDQNLVLFGYDNSGGVIKSFALTIEKNQKIKFSYEYGNGIEELYIDSSIVNLLKYTGLSISWNLGKWEMRHKTLDEDMESKTGDYSSNKTSNTNIFLGPDSHIFLGGFPSDGLLKKSNLKLSGLLVDHLRENYRTKYYKGCIYGVSLMNFDLGLQDFHYVDDECMYSKSADFVLKQTFNCKINTVLVDKFRNAIKRQKRAVTTDYNMHFTGHGYVMINTSQTIDTNSLPCTNRLNKALRIYTFPQSKINPQTFQLVAVFANEQLNIGFVLGQKNGKFHQAYWRGTENVAMRELKSTNDLIVWKVFKKDNEFVFGIDDICHPQSYMYLGGIPTSETLLREKLSKIGTPYQSYTGSMKILVVDVELFRKSSTRFTVKKLIDEKQIIGFPFYSILMPSDLAEPILLNREIFANVLKNGFSLNVDFLGNPIKEEITLMTIESVDTKLILKVSPDQEFTVHLNNEKLSLKVADTATKWRTYFVVVYIEVKLGSTQIDLSVNKPNIKGKEFPVKISTQVTRIEIGQVNIPRSFYIYDIFLGERLVNFNAPRMSSLPPNVYLKISPSALSPGGLSIPRSGESLSRTDLRVSRNREILQSDVAALPYTNNRLLYSSSIRANKYTSPTYFQSEDYPLDSAWFEGLPDSMVSLRGPVIDKLMKEKGNKVSIRLASYSKKPEMVLSITFESSKKLNIVTMNKQAFIYDSETGWNSTLRASIINKDWHLIQLSASKGSDKGLMVKIDDHVFDFPSGPISFGKPTMIEIGGFSATSQKIYYESKYHGIGMFTGCLDSLRINSKKVSLNTGIKGTKIKKCARVLEFLDVGLEILKSYATVTNNSEIVKLNIGNYNPSTRKNSMTIEFKLKYTGFEQGSVLVTGDGSKYCAIVIQDKKLYLRFKNFNTDKSQTDSLELKKNKWYNLEFIIFHMPNTITLFKVITEDQQILIHLSSIDTFSSDFIRPDIYLGGHPGLSDIQKQILTNSNRNFVGCISELNVRVRKSYVSTSLSKSRFIIPGRCSVDVFTYLRHL